MNTADQTPTFSIVTAVFNVAAYLHDFAACIEAQTIADNDLQIVVVDDGSTDESADLLKSWSSRSRFDVVLVSKANGGQSSARNLGIQHATGSWITYIDPDDWINPGYFAAVKALAEGSPDVALIGTNRVLFHEASNSYEAHPLSFMFGSRSKVVDLDAEPTYFHGSAAAGFFRRDTIASNALEFDERVRPNFEDGHYCAKYLFASEARTLGLCAEAIYYYRKRGDQSSTLQNSLQNTGRFVEVPQHGYLDVLETATERFGTVPLWLQMFVLYELSWYFSSEEVIGNSLNSCVGETAATFRALLGKIAGFLTAEAINSASARTYAQVWRDILLHSFSGNDWHASHVQITDRDLQSSMLRIELRFIGNTPDVTFVCDGKKFHPTDSKTIVHRYFDAVMACDYVAWVRVTSSLEVRVGGRQIGITDEAQIPPTTWMHATQALDSDDIRPDLRVLIQPSPSGKMGVAKLRAKYLAKRIESVVLNQLASVGPVRRRYKDAWMLMDRIHDSNDSGEVLFRYLNEHRPDINAWFAVERGTADWKRIRKSRTGKLLAHGSYPWRLAMLNTKVLASSHADRAVIRPPVVMRLHPSLWRFVFLQHGVIKDDISRWLNEKSIDLFVTSTVNEHESICGDRTPYNFTSRETKLTGLPRFDALSQARAATPEDRRNLILIAPTWRNWLSTPLKWGEQRRGKVEGFAESLFCQLWRSILHSSSIEQIAAEHSLQIMFLPHPNLVSELEAFDLPPRMPVAEYSNAELHNVFARAAVLITDYSSMAFNVAYLGLPVIYYQFDREAMFGGAHVGRGGYFDYNEQGFGPVAETEDEIIAALQVLAATGFNVDKRFADRIATAFPRRDGRCSERVTASIEAMLAGTTAEWEGG